MDEQRRRATPETNPTTTPEQSTGLPAVDEVLASLEDLANLPVDEHLPIFEEAHEQLRRALDARSTE